MSIRTLLMPAITQRLFSQQRLQARRAKVERARVARGGRHQVHYFHHVDDPYSALVAACLPQWLGRYDVELLPHLVGPPADAAAPERDKLVAYSRRDAALLARRHGLAFEDPQSQPAPADVAEAAALLLAALEDGRFVEVAGAVSEALWRGTPLQAAAGTSTSPGPQAAVQAHMRASEALRQRLGHYLGATLHYGGEWYWGIDRLHHLESRLQSLGAQRSPLSGVMFPPGDDLVAPVPPRGSPSASPRAIDFFVSLRSPYSAIVTPRVFHLADLAGASVRIRYVLPMVMRGLPVPGNKRAYITQDAAREARLRGTSFGRLNDPVGKPTERGIAVLAAAERQGHGPSFLSSFMQGVWAEGIDAGSDHGLRRISERAGVSWADACAALTDDSWRATAEANRAEMFGLGLWGVPSFRVGELSVWGQDRLWAVQEALLT